MTTTKGLDASGIGLEIRIGRVARENIETKGRRYLIEGRLLIRYVEGDLVRAQCRGAGAIYSLGFEQGDWFCDCPAKGECCHLVALQMVTVARVS